MKNNKLLSSFTPLLAYLLMLIPTIALAQDDVVESDTHRFVEAADGEQRNDILDQRAIIKSRTLMQRKVQNLRLAGQTEETMSRKESIRN